MFYKNLIGNKKINFKQYKCPTIANGWAVDQDEKSLPYGSCACSYNFDESSGVLKDNFGISETSPMYKKYLVNQDDPTIYDSWLNWYVTGEGLGVVLPGLVARRKQEAQIFKDGIYEYRTISVYNSRGVIDGTVTENNGHGYIPDTVNGGI